MNVISAIEKKIFLLIYYNERPYIILFQPFQTVEPTNSPIISELKTLETGLSLNVIRINTSQKYCTIGVKVT